MSRSKKFNIREWNEKYLYEDTVKYKDADGESQEMEADSAKMQPDEHPAKQAWLKDQKPEDGGEEKKTSSMFNTPEPGSEKAADKAADKSDDQAIKHTTNAKIPDFDDEDAGFDFEAELSSRMGKSMAYDGESSEGRGIYLDDEDNEYHIDKDGSVIDGSTGRQTHHDLNPAKTMAMAKADPLKDKSYDSYNIMAATKRRLGPDKYKQLSVGERDKEFEKQKELDKQEGINISKNTKFNIREWNEKYLYESSYTHPQDVVKARDFSDFAQNMWDNGWEFKNFPSSKKSALDKVAKDGEIAHDQLTGVKNYQDFENFVVHYLSNGKEDWYIYVDSEFRNPQAVKGSPKFRNIKENKEREVDIAQAVAKHLDKLTTGIKAYQKVTTDKGWKQGIGQILKQIEKTQAIADKEGSSRGVLPY